MAGPTILQLPRGEVCTQGAQALRWRAADGRDVLFVSAHAKFAAGTPIRGGVPVVFPWFGDDPEQRGRPAHGFARRVPWQLTAASDPAAGRVGFALQDDAGTRALWPHAFAAELAIAFDRELVLALAVTNRGAAPFRFEALLHTYLLVGDVRAVELRGLHGARYHDKRVGTRAAQREEVLRCTGEVDRVYQGTGAACTLLDPGLRRLITVSKDNAPSTVVWNPWHDKAALLTDLGGDEWLRFLCVESGCVADDAVTLAPGATHRLQVRIACQAM